MAANLARIFNKLLRRKHSNSAAAGARERRRRRRAAQGRLRQLHGRQDHNRRRHHAITEQAQAAGNLADAFLPNNAEKKVPAVVAARLAGCGPRTPSSPTCSQASRRLRRPTRSSRTLPAGPRTRRPWPVGNTALSAHTEESGQPRARGDSSYRRYELGPSHRRMQHAAQTAAGSNRFLTALRCRPARGWRPRS
jgi:hypothetical protein